MEIQSISIVSLLGATFSTITTIYFWLVRMRNERPNLKGELVERELFLGAGDAERRHIGLKLGLVVANYSSLPNAILEVKLWVQQREGTWLEVGNIAFDKATPRPFNIPALQTAFLGVTGQVAFPYSKDLELGGNKTLLAYTERFLTNPRQIKVEFKALRGQRFTSIVSYEAGS